MKIDVGVIGGGMITNDQILPSLYHLQRTGRLGHILVCARHNAPLRALAENKELRAAFPRSKFRAYPPFSDPPEAMQPHRYRDLLTDLGPRQLVIVAVPDAAHYDVIMDALERDVHVICVKPLVQQYAQAVDIARAARERGLFVGVEYHKRFDRRALVARRQYREGRFGTFVFGEAKLHEPYAYRRSNFQNWFTPDQADPFTYIGCHYVDLVHFITGLKPTAVSVDTVKGRFPNGNDALFWSSARVRFENGALLTVTNGLGYPDDAAGSNDQGLVMYCEGDGRTGMIHHDDHERGVRYSYVDDETRARYRYVSPDYFRLVPWEGEGYMPVGYGFDSIAAMVDIVRGLEGEVMNMEPGASLARRRERLRDIDEAGLIATTANSAYNEQVVEAARLSIARGGVTMEING